MLRRNQRIIAAVLTTIAITAGAFALQSSTAPNDQEKRTVIFNITRGPEELFAIVSALHVAEDALASGNRVVLFFNGAGINVPVKRLPQELRLGDERPLWRMLRDLTGRGAEVVIARESARTLGMVEADFIAQTQIGNWGGAIFSKMPANSVVFSY